MDFLDPIARPLGMVMMFFYNLVTDYGLSIIFLAIVIKAVLMPFQMKSKRGMMRQARLQPMIAELQKKHGTNKAKINEETMKLYRDEGVNPASGCLWALLPMPILMAIFQVIRKPITNIMGVDGDTIGAAYRAAIETPQPHQNEFYAQMFQTKEIFKLEDGVGEFVSRVFAENKWVEEQASALEQTAEQWKEGFTAIANGLQNIDFTFLGLDLSKVPDWQFLWNSAEGDYSSWIAGFLLFLIPLISGGAQFISMKINRKFNPQPTVEGQGKGMQTFLMIMPLFSVFIGFSTPAALGFYWTVSTVLQTGQDFWLNKVYSKKLDAEEAVRDVERKKKEAEIEAKRLETERKKAEGLVAEQNQNTSKRKRQKSNRQEQIEKAAHWDKKTKRSGSQKTEKIEPSRVGNRPYARGRAYDPNRYSGLAVASGTVVEDDDENLEDSDLEADAESSEMKSIFGISEESDTEDAEPDDADNDIDDDNEEEDDDSDEPPSMRFFKK